MAFLLYTAKRILFANELKESINETLGKGKKTPDLVLMADRDKPLEGATVGEVAKVAMVDVVDLISNRQTQEKKIVIPIHFNILKGNGLAKINCIAMYNNPPIRVGSDTSDPTVKDFRWETFYPSTGVLGVIVPANAARKEIIHYVLPFKDNLDLLSISPEEKIPILIKVFYGDDQEVKAKFFISLVKQ